MIKASRISKTFKLYSKPSDRLKEIFFRKNHHKIHNALKNISFEVADGETLGIIGPNGAGKSTLLKILTGVLLPEKGLINIDGKITGLLELGTGFNPEMTGLQNIYMNGALLSMSKHEIQQKEQEIIDFTELGDFINEPIKTYSSGMFMRLAFSIAIHADPKCFVVDEALSVGDAYFQQKCMQKIKAFRASGGSIIFVSHDLNAIKILCDKALLLNKGDVIVTGNPEQVVNKYNFLLAKNQGTKNDLILENPENNSYGNLKIEVDKVTVIGELSETNIISAGEKASINIAINVHESIKNVTIGIAIRDKFGQDIFGTNTYLNNSNIDVERGNEYICSFLMEMNIGPGKYTITAALHTEEVHTENCFNWHDKIAEFEIAGFTDSRFIGIAKLNPEIIFSEKKIAN